MKKRQVVSLAAQEAAARVTQSARATSENGLHKLEFAAMSTLCRVNCHGVSAASIRDFQCDAVAWVAQFEARYSRFIPGSPIARINAAAGKYWVETDGETDQLLALGCVTPK